MKVSLKVDSVEKIVADALIVNEFEGVKTPGGATGAADKGLKGLISSLAKEGEISGKLGSTTVIHCSGSLKAKKIIVVGLGKKEKFDLEAVRTASAAAIRAAASVKAKNVATIVHGCGCGCLDPKDACAATVEGALIGSYQFKGYASVKDEPDFEIAELVIFDHSEAKVQSMRSAVKEAVTICDAVNEARNLVNAPSNIVTPEYFAKISMELAKEVPGLTCKVLDAPELRKMGMGAFYSIAKGSDTREKMVILKWNGDAKHKKEILGLIGKGITFDSGGISLKPSGKMWEMKTDMAGAAVALYTTLVAAMLKAKKNLVTIIPLAENMPDGRAVKPGDVITSLSGKTIEIISTDAEGRMLLADSVTYAKQLGATSLIDVATLTGACVVCLGDVATGIMGNDSNLLDAIKQAANKTGEKVWELPLYEEYKEYAKSMVADIKNATETGKAGTCTGGQFIQLFVEDTPWVHMDIAGTNYLHKGRAYLGEGATGVPLRTLVQFLKD